MNLQEQLERYRLGASTPPCYTASTWSDPSAPTPTTHPGRASSEFREPLRSSGSLPPLSDSPFDHCMGEQSFPDIARAIGEAFQVDCCLLVEDHPTMPNPLAHWKRDPAANIQLPPPLLWHLFNSTTPCDGVSPGQCFAIADLRSLVPTPAESPGMPSRREALELFMASGLRAFLLLRVPQEHQTHCWIVLARTSAYSWPEDELRSLHAASTHLTTMITQAKLERRVYQHNQYQTLLNRLNESIRSSRHLKDIFQLAVEETTTMLGMSRGALLTFKHNPPWLHRRHPQRASALKVMVEVEQYALSTLPSPPPSPESSDGWDSAPTEQRYPTLDPSSCSLFQALLECPSAPIIIDNVSSEAAYLLPSYTEDAASVHPFFAFQQYPALLAIPFENQGLLLGCLLLQHHSPYRWQPEEIKFCSLVAAQLCTAVIQMQTLQQVQSLVEERTAQLQKSLDVQAKLYEKSRQQLKQMQRLNQRQEEFLSTVSHELLTPLTSMTVAIRMLRQVDSSPERRTKYLDILEQQCLQETDLINDLLTLQRLESGRATLRLQALDLRYSVRDAVQSTQEQWMAKRLILDIQLPDQGVNVQTDLDSFTRVLTELLVNACKYAEPATTVTVALTQEFSQPHNWVTLSIANRGVGILPDDLPHIFDKFHRGEGMTQRAVPGTGLGLALVKGLVEHLHGMVEASSAPLDDSASHWRTCFTVTLPQFPPQRLV